MLLAILRCLLFIGWGSIDPAGAVRTLVLILPPVIVVTLLCLRWLGPDRGPLLASITVVIVLAGPDLRFLIVIPATAIVLVLERQRSTLGRLRLPWPRINEAFTVAVGAFVVVQLAMVLVFGPGPAAARDAWAAPAVPLDRPDVFIVLADGHPRADTLRDMYGYDETPFLEALGSMGFEVAPGSRSNYMRTRFSLASFFTGSYLPGLGELSVEDQNRLAARTTHDNPAFGLLERLGYDVTVVSAGYEHLGLRGAGTYIDTGQANEYEAAMIQNSLLSSARHLVSPTWDFDQARWRVFDSLAALQGLVAADTDRPQFTFVHLPVPHWPWVFNASCGIDGLPGDQDPNLQRHGGTPETHRLLVDQVACTNRLLSDLLRALVAARPNAVVLLFSDHGSEEYLDWWAPDAVGLAERSRNLVALRSPGRPGLLPEDITLVNILPTLFNAYLGTSLPKQPDQVWFGPRPQDNSFTLLSPSSGEMQSAPILPLSSSASACSGSSGTGCGR